MEDLRSAIDKRVSRRTYLKTSLPPEAADHLRGLAQRLNEKEGLRIQLVEDDDALFRNFFAGYGMFSGVRHYFALVGPKDDPVLLEKLGFAGERLVLEATRMGLGTCWVGGTFRRGACETSLKLGTQESLPAIICVGEVPQEKTGREKLLSKVSKRRSKTVDEMLTFEGEVPGWVLEGMQAVVKAPSALNAQPVRFHYEGGRVTAAVEKPQTHQGLDLGIARLHFELGTKTGIHWQREGEQWFFTV